MLWIRDQGVHPMNSLTSSEVIRRRREWARESVESDFLDFLESVAATLESYENARLVKIAFGDSSGESSDEAFIERLSALLEMHPRLEPAHDEVLTLLRI